jgi:hypothetical protein
MAQLVGIFNMTHSPFCYMPAERWSAVRASRPIREDVPVDSDEENFAKAARIKQGFASLREKMSEARPDVIIVFGDDQLECFDFNNYPPFAIHVGEEFHGDTSAADQNYIGTSRGDNHNASQRMRGHPEMATALLTGLMKRGFDPAFMMDMPKPDGLGHAIMRPAESLTDFSVPIVSVLVNCYYAPQVTGMRCYQLGKAVREAIDEYPGDLRVAVVGSGGLWHTPGARHAYLDEDFDRKSLEYMVAGDARAMAEHFDTYCVPEGDVSQPIKERGNAATGLPGPGGPQGGTRETCNWIIATAVANGAGAEIVDYVPVYSSPIGAGFAYWPKV